MGKNKIGPLGTPLGNPIKFFREQRESRLPKADSGMGMLNSEMAKEADMMKNLEPLPPIPKEADRVTPPSSYPVGGVNPIDPKMIRAIMKSGIRG